MTDEIKKVITNIPEASDELVAASDPYQTDGRARSSYSKLNVVRQSNGRLYGKWNNSFDKACVGAPTTYIQEQAIVALYENIGTCSNGAVMCECIHK